MKSNDFRVPLPRYSCLKENLPFIVANLSTRTQVRNWLAHESCHNLAHAVKNSDWHSKCHMRLYRSDMYNLDQVHSRCVRVRPCSIGLSESLSTKENISNSIYYSLRHLNWSSCVSFSNNSTQRRIQSFLCAGQHHVRHLSLLNSAEVCSAKLCQRRKLLEI